MYYLYNNGISPFDPLGRRQFDPTRQRIQLRMCDTIFIVIYIGSYLPLLIDLASPTDPVVFIVPFTLAGALGVLTVYALSQKLRMSHTNSSCHPDEAKSEQNGEETTAGSVPTGVPA